MTEPTIDTATDASGFVHRIRGRDGECEMQKVVLNTHFLGCRVSCWGNTGFDVGVEGTSCGEARFTAGITYISVVGGTTTTAAVPALVRERLA